MEDDVEEIKTIIASILTLKDRVIDLTQSQTVLSKNLDNLYTRQLGIAENLIQVHNMYASN